MRTELPETVEVKNVIKETPSIKTIEFDKAFDFTPGQFIMVWIPGLDEIPLSLSGESQVTVKKVGEATEALHNMSEGDQIGLRGPYGNGFSIDEEKVLAVGGGVGIAPLKPLVQKEDKSFSTVLGAGTSDELFFRNEFTNPTLCTDDGTEGKEALATEIAEKMVEEDDFDAVAACGPEIMLKFLFKTCEENDLKSYFSMERWMKCGMGVCGQCAIDPTGWRVCKDGPIATNEILRESEFFEYKRDQAGRKTEI